MGQPSDGSFISFAASGKGILVGVVLFLSAVIPVMVPIVAFYMIGSDIIAERQRAITNLTSHNTHERYQAAEYLIKHGNKASIEPLKDALKDEDASVRLAAAEALINTDIAASESSLIAMLDDTGCTYPYQDMRLGEVLLNSESADLKAATESWLKTCGYDTEEVGGRSCPVEVDPLESMEQRAAIWTNRTSSMLFSGKRF